MQVWILPPAIGDLSKTKEILDFEISGDRVTLFPFAFGAADLAVVNCARAIFTSVFLEEEKLIVVVVYSVTNSESNGFVNIKKATDKAIKNNFKVIGLSSSSLEVTEEFKRQNDLNFDFYFCDETALKTVVRSNPSLISLRKGTIIQKLHWNDSSKLLVANKK